MYGFENALGTERVGRPPEVVLPGEEEVASVSQVGAVRFPHHLRYLQYGPGAAELPQRLDEPFPEHAAIRHGSSFSRSRPRSYPPSR